jgi:uncharacterized membrane protein YhaH (DUF805 family)
MFCPKCGQEQPENTNFCGKCGTGIALPHLAASPISQTIESVSFARAISVCFSKYFDFKGRASRPEYWWFYLFCTVLSWGYNISLQATISNTPSLSAGTVMIMKFGAMGAIFFPFLAAGVRRLHDTNRSGWRFLWAFTIIGVFIIYIWLAGKGTENENKYGSPV